MIYHYYLSPSTKEIGIAITITMMNRDTMEIIHGIINIGETRLRKQCYLILHLLTKLCHSYLLIRKKQEVIKDNKAWRTLKELINTGARSSIILGYLFDDVELHSNIAPANWI